MARLWLAAFGCSTGTNGDFAAKQLNITIMKIYSEKSLRNFEFWSDAKENASKLTSDQLDTVDSMMEEIQPEGWEETEINDLFRFDFDTIKEWLGITDEEDE